MLRFRLLVLFFGLIFSLCSKPDDQAIRELISQMKADAEALNWTAFQSHISKHYKDKSGNNYFIINQLIKNYVQGVESMEAQVEIMGISIREDEAEAQIKLIAKGQKSGRLYYLVGREQVPEYPRLWFKKEGRHWRLIRVEGVKRGEESLW